MFSQYLVSTFTGTDRDLQPRQSHLRETWSRIHRLLVQRLLSQHQLSRRHEQRIYSRLADARDEAISQVSRSEWETISRPVMIDMG